MTVTRIRTRTSGAPLAAVLAAGGASGVLIGCVLSAATSTPGLVEPAATVLSSAVWPLAALTCPVLEVTTVHVGHSIDVNLVVDYIGMFRTGTAFVLGAHIRFRLLPTIRERRRTALTGWVALELSVMGPAFGFAAILARGPVIG